MTAPKSYHHGDLRAALQVAAMQLLEDGEPFSLRAVARRAGVSPTAPYRHFPDRAALESALAAEGFRTLESELSRAGLPGSEDELFEFGVVYVAFALRRPTLFRLMYGGPCDATSDERVRAIGALNAWLARALAQVFPKAQTEPLALATWSLAHGLACLHLDGKLPTSPPEAVAERARGAFRALVAAHPTTG